MTYQVLARKWRPQDFNSLVGQQPIVTALRNALTEDRIAQAYIFSGIRGVGKTTTARVLAKALNCPTRAEQRGTDPCNACRSCTEITAGGDLDVIEVDAATYSKVEQVRELTESLRYAPANDRYKVVVLDEVHRLSRQAFDALLKIVEEPPPHLVFIFATTELDAVPATILSRCQQFQFRRVAAQELATYLGEICQRESITASDNALRLIARAAEGSVRDAVALLDQLATFGQNTVEDEAAGQLIGGMDTRVLRVLLEAILGGDAAGVRQQLHDVERYGWDPYKVFGQFLAYLRDALHLSMKGATEVVDLPSEEAESLAKLVGKGSYENVLRMLTLLLDAEETVRRSEFGNLALEVSLLRAAELPKLTRIEEWLAGGLAGKGGPSMPQSSGGSGPSSSGGGAAGGGAAGGRPGRGGRPGAPTRQTAPQSQAATQQTTPPRESRPSSPPQKAADPVGRNDATHAPDPSIANAAPTSPPAGSASGEDLLATVRDHRPPLAAHLRRSRIVAADGLITIGIPAGDALLSSALERPANATVLDQAVATLWGSAARWRTEALIGAVESAPESHTGSSPRRGAKRNGGNENAVASRNGAASSNPRSKHPTVQAVLEVFTDGTVESIQPHESDTASS